MESGLPITAGILLIMFLYKPKLVVLFIVATLVLIAIVELLPFK